MKKGRKLEVPSLPVFVLPRDVYLGIAQGKMDIENVSAFRRRILSTSVRQMPGASVAEFAVTGVAFLWHQAWFLGSIRWGQGIWWVEGDTESGGGRMK